MIETPRMNLPRMLEARAQLRTAVARPAPRTAVAASAPPVRAGVGREWRLPNGDPPPLVLWGDEK